MSLSFSLSAVRTTTTIAAAAAVAATESLLMSLAMVVAIISLEVAGQARQLLLCDYCFLHLLPYPLPMPSQVEPFSRLGFGLVLVAPASPVCRR